MIVMLMGCLVTDRQLEEIVDADGDGIPIGEDCDDQDRNIGLCAPPPEVRVIDQVATLFGGGRQCSGEALDVATVGNGTPYLVAGSRFVSGPVEIYRLDSLTRTAQITDPHPRFGASVQFIGEELQRAQRLAIGRPTDGERTYASLFQTNVLECGSCTEALALFSLGADLDDGYDTIASQIRRSGDNFVFSGRRSDAGTHILFKSIAPPDTEPSFFEFAMAESDGVFALLREDDGGFWFGSPSDQEVFFTDIGQTVTTRITSDLPGFGADIVDLGERLVVTAEDEVVVFVPPAPGDTSVAALDPLRLTVPGVGAVASGDFVGSTAPDLVVVSNRLRQVWILDDPPSTGAIDLETQPSIALERVESPCRAPRLGVFETDGRDVLVVADPAHGLFWRVDQPGAL